MTFDPLLTELVCRHAKSCFISSYRGKVKEMLRLRGDCLLDTPCHMLNIRRLAINLGLVDNPHHGNDSDGRARRILVLKERA